MYNSPSCDLFYPVTLGFHTRLVSTHIERFVLNCDMKVTVIVGEQDNKKILSNF